MNWEAAGAVGEIIGAMGVIASLLYLAMQVRVSNKAAAIESKLAVSRMHSDFIGSLIQNPELDEILRKGLAGLEPLPKEDYRRFSNMALQAFTFFSAGYFQVEAGTMDSDEWHESEMIIQYWVQGQGFKDWWKKDGRRRYSPGFVSYIDRRYFSE